MTTKPTARIEQVTPAMADKYLGTQQRNRSLRDSRVEYLMALIERGEWTLTNDAISFDTDGRLINGQHRLTAIAAASVTLPLLVLRGLPPEVQDVMDSGLARNVSDALKMRGETYVHSLGAACRWEHRLRYVEANDGEVIHYGHGGDRPTTLAVLAIFDEDPAGWREAAYSVMAFQKQIRMRAGAGACLWRRFHQLDYDDAQAFFTGFISGAGLEAGSAVLQLRDQLGRTVAKGMHRMQDYREAALIIKAWNYYRDGDRPKVLAWKWGGTHREPFPLPH
jgi:hypothetical protein